MASYTYYFQFLLLSTLIVLKCTDFTTAESNDKTSINALDATTPIGGVNHTSGGNITTNIGNTNISTNEISSHATAIRTTAEDHSSAINENIAISPEKEINQGSTSSDEVAINEVIPTSTPKEISENKIPKNFPVTTVENHRSTQSTVCNTVFRLDDSKKQSTETYICLCDSRSFTVDCSHMDLSKLPSYLSFPANMHVVSFRGNHIMSINVDTFYSGREVLDLDLSNNEIKFISAEAFKGFERLQRLWLQHNNLWSLNQMTFDALTHLKSLDLSYNDLDKFFPDMFQKLGELKELNLEGNPLKVLQERQFEFLVHIEVLNLNSAMLQTLPDHLFAFTNKLRTLKLANNRMEVVPTAAFKSLAHLRILDLSGNAIRVLGPQSFIGMESLTVLYLNQVPTLKAIEAHALGDLKSLKEFRCSHNMMLSEIHQEAFINKTSRQRVTVNQLILRQNNLAMISPWLQKWNPNMELQLADNPWDCNCQIYWLLDLQTKNRFMEHVKCASPLQLRGRILSEITAEDLPCGIALSDVIMISAAATVSVMLLLLIVAFLLHKRAYAKSHSKRFKHAPSNSDFEDVVYSKTYETMDMY